MKGREGQDISERVKKKWFTTRSNLKKYLKRQKDCQSPACFLDAHKLEGGKKRKKCFSVGKDLC